MYPMRRLKQLLQMLTIGWAAAMLALAPQGAVAQTTDKTEAERAVSAEVATEDAKIAEASEGAEALASQDSGEGAGYTPLGPEMIKGQPVDGEWNVQPQYSEIGSQAKSLHDGLSWVMVLISAFVLALLIYVIFRYNKRANPEPSKTTHNTMIEVIWMVVPALILLAIAIPSFKLLAKQYESPPADAVTIKVIGYQWYWGYAYPDNGGFEVVSNMLPEDQARAKGLPAQLAVDKRMVVPANTPLRIQTTAADVIHSFAVPSLWFKLDAVPGRLNEQLLTIKEPGIYYGQCSELCGVKHGYMPIAVEALPRDEWEAWVLSQPGGTLGGEEETEEDEAGAESDAEPEDGDAEEDEDAASAEADSE